MTKNIINSIRKLKNRKSITVIAVNKLISIVKELETYLTEDLVTIDTKIKVKMKIDIYKKNYTENKYDCYNEEGSYSLKIVDGKIVISDFFDLGDDYWEMVGQKENLEITDLEIKNDSDKKRYEILKFDFESFIMAIEEVMFDATNAAETIDQGNQKFIDFCNDWEAKAA